MEVKFLWIQEMVKARKIQIRKIRGDTNPADNLTKPKMFKDMGENGKMKSIGATIVKRRVEWADMNDLEDVVGPWGYNGCSGIRGGVLT